MLGICDPILEIEAAVLKLGQFAPENVTLSATIFGVPEPTLIWRTNTGEELQLQSTTDETSKYHVNYDGREFSLTINNLSSIDSGYYTLIANNRFDRKEKQFELQVHGNSIKYIFILDIFLFVY